MKTSEEPPVPKVDRTVHPAGPPPPRPERRHHCNSRGAPSHLSQFKRSSPPQLEKVTMPTQERSTQTTIREVQPATTREEPTHHIWRRAPPHIAITEDYPCPMQPERSPPPQLVLTTHHN